MCLSKKTLCGLRMTGINIIFAHVIQTCIMLFIIAHSFVELTRYHLTHPGNGSLALLSEQLSQDPLENYFGMQRTRGRRCDNPTPQESLQNSVAICAQHSLQLDRVQGNCQRKHQLFPEGVEIDDTRLQMLHLHFNASKQV